MSDLKLAANAIEYTNLTLDPITGLFVPTNEYLGYLQIV